MIRLMPESINKDIARIAIFDTINWRQLKKDAYYLSLANTILGISRCKKEEDLY